MILVDSSAWITYLLDQPLAGKIEKYLENPDKLLVPTIILYEVYRHLIKKIPEQDALMIMTQLQKGIVIPIDEEISLKAAEISWKYKLGLADSMIYTILQWHKAELITLDNDFRNLDACTVLSS